MAALCLACLLHLSCFPGVCLQHPHCTPIVCAGVLGRAHTVAAMDQTKLQEASGSGLHSVYGVKAGVAADPADSSAWRKQRPRATFFEKLQVRLADPAVVFAILICLEGNLIECFLQYLASAYNIPSLQEACC